MQNRIIPIGKVMLSALALSFALAACGGGGSGSSTATSTVPTQATVNLATDEQSARDIVVLAVGADDSAAGTNDNFKRTGPISPVGNGGAVRVAMSGVGPDKKIIRESLPCTDIYQVGTSIGNSSVASCSGTMVIESNFDQYIQNNQNVPIPAGGYVTSTFVGFNITSVSGETFSLSGSFTLTVLTTLDISSSVGFVGSYRLSAQNLAGVDETGATFGPENFSMDVTSNADGTISIVYDGVRVDDINVIETDDDDTYRITSGSMIVGYDDGHADVTFDNWDVVDGVPQAGSQLVVSGVNGSGSVRVLSATSTSVTFEVTITAEGTTEVHTVQASVSNGQLVLN